MHGGLPYCGYQTGTCPTCGSGNSPYAAYTCHLLAECPTIRARHECRLPDRPYSTRICGSACTWTPLRERGWRRSCGTTGALYLFTLRVCERAISARMKNELSYEREEIGRRRILSALAKVAGKTEKKNYGLRSKQLLKRDCSAR